MGIIVACVFIVQMILTFLSAFISVSLTKQMHQNSIISELQYISLVQELFIKWGSWVLLFTNFVPISLIVSLEMVKYIQGINISQSEYQTQKPAEVVVQTSSLNE